MRNTILAFTALLAGAMSSSAGADPSHSVECETCKTDEQFRDEAAKLESLNGGNGGYFYVFNLGDNVVQKWYIAPSRGDAEKTPAQGSTNAANKP